MSRYALSLRTLWTAAALTAVVVVLPFVRFAYRAPALHVALETANAIIGLLVAYLVYGRYRDSGRLQELLLLLALSTVAVANLALTALPSAVPAVGDIGGWAPLGVRLVGTLLLAAAALTGSGVRAPGALGRPAVLVGVVVLVLLVLDVVLGDDLPPTIDPDVDLTDASSPLVAGHPVVLVVQVVSGLAYALAAVTLTRQAARERDELLRWVGAGCVLSAFARVHYFLFPSLYSDYVYTGDAFRLAFYVFLLVGAAREIGSYWEARARAAVLEDRRRLARDLHDGLTQELSYIYAQTRHLEAHPDDARAVARVNDAAARAIDEARTAIAALTRSDQPGFAELLRSSVDGLAQRYDVSATTSVDDVVLPPERAEAVLRIVGEAFRNGVRHGQASSVHVQVSGDPLEVVVRDDGQGFDPAAPNIPTTGGFGLTSMRERAEALGGRLDITSERGKGTTVRVVCS